MTGREVTAEVERRGEYDAGSILEEALPGAAEEFMFLMGKVKALQKRVERLFPDVNIYLANDDFHLMLGVTHGESDNASDSPSHQERIGATYRIPGAGGGDW